VAVPVDEIQTGIGASGRRSRQKDRDTDYWVQHTLLATTRKAIWKNISGEETVWSKCKRLLILLSNRQIRFD
jgi:hypothetical protein